MVLVKDSRREVVALQQVSKVYPGRAGVRALHGVTLRFARGTFTAVMGPSGSGKSALLRCAPGLDRPTGGRVTLAAKTSARCGSRG
jgi:putative ABC transport system ATP-binding protein